MNANQSLQSCTESFTNLSLNETLYSDKNTVQLALDDKSLLPHLEHFQNICEHHEKHRRRSCKKRFYDPGLIARVTCHTTDDDLRKLLNNGTLTFLFDGVTVKPSILAELVARTSSAIEEYQNRQPRKHVVPGLALEITGDGCRLGRCRNDCSLMLNNGDVITLTTDETYRMSGYKEVCYVIHLKHYLKAIKLRDYIKIGNAAKGRVVKKLLGSIVVCVDKPGIINSYDYIALPNQCYACSQEEMASMFINDLSIANDLNAHYIVMSKVRCKSFLQELRRYMESDFSFLKLIGSIDFEYVGAYKLDLIDILQCLDFLWIRDFFRSPNPIKTHICDFVIPKAKYLNKPIIGSVPLQCCNQFKCFLNHSFLWKIDSMFIEKSWSCCKYPLIVKKLLPIQNFSHDVTKEKASRKILPKTYQSRVNFIIGCISKERCNAIFLCMGCKAAAEALNSIEIYCPVYVVLPVDSLSSDVNELKCILGFARALNLRRNSYAIIYTADMNENDYSPLDYGIDYALSKGCIEIGDFLITVELSGQVSRDSDIDSTEDVILSAFFLPQPQLPME